MGVLDSQLSVKMLVISQLSVKMLVISQLSVKMLVISQLSVKVLATIFYVLFAKCKITFKLKKASK